MPLKVDVVTIFPAMVQGPLGDGIVRRAVERGLVGIDVHDLRDYSDDRHRSVDDTAFGGGPGMVMKAEPFFRVRDALLPEGVHPRAAVVLLSPRGRRFDQATARRYAALERLVLLCGRYEGIDERVRQGVATEEVSLGDFVLTGGEVAALAVVEATVRLLPGALGDERSADEDSFADGLFDHPHYTRPAVVRGMAVPEALLSGNHERIRRWRRKEALRATRERRPDLLREAALTREDAALLRELEDEAAAAAAAREEPPREAVVNEPSAISLGDWGRSPRGGR
jgi:tRNA (guanine37-N1)-methyltransferase